MNMNSLATEKFDCFIQKNVTMKKIILAVLILVGTVSYAGTPVEVNEKVLKAFKETFTNPEEVVWREFDTYYEVNFKLTEIRTRIRYDVEGNVLGTTRYYFEQTLPPHILTKIKKKYSGKSIFGVTEVSSEYDIEYYIVLEDDKNWTTVRSNSVGSMEVHEKFKKAPTK